MPILYEQVYDSEVQEKVRSRRYSVLAELKRLNFDELCFYSESVGALGFSPLGVWGFMGSMIALFNEVAKIQPNLSISTFHVMMVSRQHAAYACPFGLGVKFYTGFTDGTCIITANFESEAINNIREKIQKSAMPRAVETAWRDHQAWMNELAAQGKQKNEHISYTSAIELARREDDYMLKYGQSI
jgi:hypothetical protein